MKRLSVVSLSLVFSSFWYKFMNVEISSDYELTKPLFVLSHKLSKNTIVRVTCKSITGVMIIKKYL